MDFAIQKKCLSLGKYGCLLFCYAFVGEIDELRIITSFNLLRKSNIIDDECFIKSADKLYEFFRVPASVRKATPEEAPRNLPYVAYWKASETKEGHFVVMKNNKVIYDPNGQSINVAKGKVESIRIVTRGKV